MKKNSEFAIFGGGCFWCTEAVFQRLNGVIEVMPGYAGGKLNHPSYLMVSTGLTGHAEVVKIEFNPDVISYADLLEVFWAVHDPTTLNRQGADVGTQYRSVIICCTDEQMKTAMESLEVQKKSGEYKAPIVTEILPFKEFFTAEEYHHNYYNNNRDAMYCQLVISPKLEHLQEKFSKKLKHLEPIA